MALTAAVAAPLVSAAACGQSRTPTTEKPSGTAATRASDIAVLPRGGAIVASIHTDPRSFNRFVARDSSSYLVATLTHAGLVRLNRVTQEIEPWLAESWTRSADGLRYSLKLRPSVSFSDGHAFSSDDVVFSFDAVYDPKTGSSVANALQVGGKPLKAVATGPLSVDVFFPEPFAPGLRILETMPILPRHKLGAALKDGTFARAWGLSTPPADLAGLGPFVLKEYVSGERLLFTRNEKYWRKDASGAALPYLDQITVEIVPDQNVELLRLEAGQLDMTTGEVRPEDYAPLKRAAEAGKVQLLDLGAGFDADSFWINLKPGGLGKNDTRAAWLQHDALRRAISLAVDRELFANTVFLGAGVPVWGPVTPGNRKWFANLPPIPHDPARAKAELAAIGLTDRNADGMLEDQAGRPVRFSLLAQKGNSSIERGAAVIRDELKKMGVAIDVVALDGTAVIERFLSGNYDAVYFRVGATDSDPAVNPDFWFSSGSAHAWHLEQKTPATAWEARIDGLMRQQTRSADEAERKQLFVEVQKIFAEHLPMVQFVAPRIYVAASKRVTNLTPTAFGRPQLLWAPDTIAVAR